MKEASQPRTRVFQSEDLIFRDLVKNYDKIYISGGQVTRGRFSYSTGFSFKNLIVMSEATFNLVKLDL